MPEAFNFNPDEGLTEDKEKEFEKLFEEVEKEEKGDVLENNRKARDIIKSFTSKIQVELDDVLFFMVPITVKLWDTIGGKTDSEENKTELVYQSLVSPKLTREEFDELPAPLKIKLYQSLMKNFFQISSRVRVKTQT